MNPNIQIAIDFLKEDIGYLELQKSERGWLKQEDEARIICYRLAIEALCDMKINLLHRQGVADWMP